MAAIAATQAAAGPLLASQDVEAAPSPAKRYLIDRHLKELPSTVISSSGNYLHFSNGQKVFDATCGAAVACLGHGNPEVNQAIIDQLNKNAYCNSMLFTVPVSGELAEEIIAGTGNLMERVYLCSSGSEAAEAMMKMARQFFVETEGPDSPRTRYIAREHSYHGNTLGALGLSGHLARRKIYEPILNKNVSWVSACNAYRQRLDGESDEAFVRRKAEELEGEFQKVGPGNVIAFVAEPISGAALGCVPYVPGYLAAMKAVCKRHGALFVLDEVMSGMGRCGTLHAWQAEHVDGDPEKDCIPDLQMVGKGLGGGYQAIAGIIVGKKVIDGLESGTNVFVHGHTYQALPVSCAASLAVQRIIKRDNIMSNVSEQGAYLSQLLLERVAPLKYVGNVRGKGLFWGIELVRDKETKKPFEKSLSVTTRVTDLALTEKWNIAFYPGQGTCDGVSGDHVIVAPAYNVTRADIELVVDRLVGVLEEVFERLDSEFGL
jgi:adenosylmethionine-8-amino-7-oxononanoate aminotransferase